MPAYRFFLLFALAGGLATGCQFAGKNTDEATAASPLPTGSGRLVHRRLVTDHRQMETNHRRMEAADSAMAAHHAANAAGLYRKPANWLK